jgi:hypothetical protein
MNRIMEIFAVVIYAVRLEIVERSGNVTRVNTVGFGDRYST